MITPSESLAAADDEEATLEEITVTVWKDQSHAVYGGVERPVIGDGLRRLTAVDPDQRPFSFTGEVVNSVGDQWVLRFRRRAVVTTGTSHLRQG